VSFSSISRSFHERDWKALFSRLESSINLLFITLIPSSCLLCGLKSEIVSLLYERGAFTTLETELTSKALLGYGVGLLFYGLSVLFVRAFSSIHDTRTPAIVGITSILLNGLLDIILMIPYKNFGIALATSIVSLYNFLLLFLLWRKKTGYGLRNESLMLIGKSILSGLIILIVVGMTKRFFQNPVLLVILDGFCALSIVYFLFRGFFHGTVIPSRS
jgi:putative peptidoglycan lipid II flippase